MRKSYFTTVLSVGVALASLSSCSRADYAFNPKAPSYLGSTRVHSATVTAPAEPVLTASADAATPAVVASPARVAATALARPHAAAPVVEAAARPSVAVAELAAPAAPRAALSKVERKELKQQLRQVAKQQKAASPNGTKAEGKSQLVAALLCFFLGGLGIHDFYLGYIGKGILQIVLSIIVIGFILVIIDLVRILTGSLKPKDGDYTSKL